MYFMIVAVIARRPRRMKNLKSRSRRVKYTCRESFSLLRMILVGKQCEYLTDTVVV